MTPPPGDTAQAFQQTVSTQAFQQTDSMIKQRAELLQCLCLGAFRRDVNTNGERIDFNRAVFLGLPNPLLFSGRGVRTSIIC